jgi:hypothetical protein
MNEETILVIGYYNRKNIGDECYKIAFPLLFQNVKKMSFVCSDDIEVIPDDVTTVICGGGDIINDYFMKKIHELLKSFLGRIYAVSVGIPFLNATKYLHIFDHIFVRSTTDYDRAIEEVGARNVSCIKDISACIPVIHRIHNIHSNKKVRIGIALAQPYFYENPNKTKLINSLANVLIKLYKNNHNIEYHFLNFNYDESHQENDRIISNTINHILTHNNIPSILHNEITSPIVMINFINNKVDLTLCMRYHSIMFSLIANKRVVPLFLSSKIKNILKDIEYDMRFAVELHADNNYQPTNIDESCLYEALSLAIENQDFTYSHTLDINQFEDITNKILCEKKNSDILVYDKFKSFEDVLISCKRSLCKYLHIDPLTFENILMNKGPLYLNDKQPLEIARFICFIISGKTHHPCVWGLTERLTDNDFQLYESIMFIWQTCKISHDIIEREHLYYPSIKGLNRRVLLNLDYIFQNDFSQYHRAGWSYVIGGLMNLDAQHLSRQTDVMLDTYLDRSFHWGYDILKYIGMVPYVKPWFGFVHHTFDNDHSEYNCNNLLENPDFIESLKCCKGILVLSEYLAKQFRNAFLMINIDVPVYTLYHPTEFVDNNFTIDKFINNQNKKIVQIGAWLRNPYGIYEIPLPPDGGVLKITKVALKGKEMDQYFPPPDFLKTMENVLTNYDWFHHKTIDPNHSNGEFPDSFCNDKICRDDCNFDDKICRDDCNFDDNICRNISRPPKGFGNSSVNKFCKGLYDHIVYQLDSVIVLDKLSNDDYDNLLSDNIIFLHLVDCSAVNTVIECIVRNTPLLVNRLAPLEEILGINYPGFYDNLNQVADICQNINKIKAISDYINSLDKTRYKLEFFIDHLQNIIGSKNIIEYESIYKNYELFIHEPPPPPKQPIIKINLYSNLLQFLPNKSLYYSSLRKLSINYR